MTATSPTLLPVAAHGLSGPAGATLASPVSRCRRLAASVPGGLVIPATLAVVVLGTQVLRRRPLRRSRSNAAMPPNRAEASPGSLDILTQECASDPAGGAAAAKLPPPLPEFLLNTHVQCPLDHLFGVVMAPDDTFSSTQHNRHGYTDVHIGSWDTAAEGGSMTRCIRFTQPLSGRVGPRHAVCYSHYTLLERTANGFHVSMEAHTPEVPYGRSFHQHIRFVGMARGPDACELTVSAEVVFTKWVPGIASLIRSSAKQGMRDTYATWPASIQAALERGNHPDDMSPPAVSATSSSTVINAVAVRGRRSRVASSGRVPKTARMGSRQHLPMRLLVFTLKLWLLVISLVSLHAALRVPVRSPDKIPSNEVPSNRAILVLDV